MREPGHPKLLNNSFDQMKIMARGNILPSLSGITETGGKIGDILLDYWFNENREYGELGGNQ